MATSSRDMALKAALRDDPKKPHAGPIMGRLPGRHDHVKMHVQPDSFVIPADVVSGLGDGNTMSGMRVLDQMFKPKATTMKKGGRVKGNAVPIVAADGEYVIAPDQVAKLGRGDPKHGHAILDQFVKNQRKKTIKTLAKLPGPEKS